MQMMTQQLSLLLLPVLLGEASLVEEVQRATLARREREGNSTGEEDLPEEEECHTSAEGEQCHAAVVWAQQYGILQHPEWYEGLTHHSSFEAFQDLLSEHGQSSCRRPCNLCHTAVEGERCFETVQWAMLVGIREHAEWYPGLVSGSSFEEFQSLVHRNGGNGDCPKAPCNLCRTVTEGGELCFKEVNWAMTHGIHSHPEWYSGLSVNSSRAEFQQYLSLKYDCPQACSTCRTAEPGELCHKGVMWAMTHGIAAHPEWYPELEADSSFEAFQAHLHHGRFENCPMPCNYEDE